MPFKYENCKNHRWPYNPTLHSMRSEGTTKVFQCNSCLALKVEFTSDVWLDGRWAEVKSESIIEPSFKPA